MTAALCAAALTAAERGWSVFPLWPGTKIPALHRQDTCPRTRACQREHHGWEHRATRDPDRIRRCWATRPYNVGIATGPSRLVVIDLDRAQPDQTPPPPWNQPGIHHGTDVFLTACADAGHTPPLDTYTVSTPSGGTHLYYQAPPGVVIRNSAGGRGRGLGWKVDVRAGGGQILAAGSRVHGRSYRVMDDAAVMALPDWLATRLATPPPPPRLSVPFDALLATVAHRSSYAASALRGEIDRVLTAGVSGAGCRNDTLNTAAFSLGRLVAVGLIPEHLAHDALLLAGTTVGLPERECRATIRSGLSAGQHTSRRTLA